MNPYPGGLCRTVPSRCPARSAVGCGVGTSARRHRSGRMVRRLPVAPSRRPSADGCGGRLRSGRCCVRCGGRAAGRVVQLGRTVRRAGAAQSHGRSSRQRSVPGTTVDRRRGQSHHPGATGALPVGPDRTVGRASGRPPAAGRTVGVPSRRAGLEPARAGPGRRGRVLHTRQPPHQPPHPGTYQAISMG